MKDSSSVSDPVYRQVEVGSELPELVKRPSNVQLFRYSAVTWNAHRIHYDRDYAAKEGYPGVLVHSHLHGAFLTQLCTDWMGSEGCLQSLEVRVKLLAVSGDTLTCKGTVVEKTRPDEKGVVVVDLVETNQWGEVCASGKAVIEFPLTSANEVR